MIVAFDIGNSNITFGLFENHKLTKLFRLSTKVGSTSDEYGVFVGELLDGKFYKVKEVVISSVVRELEPVFLNMCKKYFGFSPTFLSAKKLSKIFDIDYKTLDTLGVDRVVNAISAYGTFREAVIIVDFGTATTIDCVDESGRFLGGAILPGFEVSAKSLSLSTSSLFVPDFSQPKNPIGKDTETSILSGLLFGHIGAVDSVVKRMWKELGKRCRVVATGGFLHLFEDLSETITDISHDLTLKGIFMAYRIMKGE